jgi:hypothetical protein
MSAYLPELLGQWRSLAALAVEEWNGQLISSADRELLQSAGFVGDCQDMGWNRPA